jgi:hypothetical protein
VEELQPDLFDLADDATGATSASTANSVVNRVKIVLRSLMLFVK